MKKTGGIWFWKMGRFGGSFYISKAKPRDRIQERLDYWRKKERRHIAPVTDLMWAALIGLPSGWFFAALFF